MAILVATPACKMSDLYSSPIPKSIDPKSAICEHVVRLIVFDPSSNKCYTAGTGVIILNSVIMTAAHVIDDIFEKQNPFNLKIKVENDVCDVHGCEVWVIQILPNDQEYLSIWTPHKIFRSTHSDMCLIQIVPYNDIAAQYKEAKRWGAPVLNLNPPSVGEEIFSFGYHGTEMKFSINETDGTHIDIKDKPTLSSGKVTKIYPVRRDTAKLPFPCFETNSYAESGMSGGPAFNKNGELCGIISTSLPNEDKTVYTSYILSLWPIMDKALSIEINGELGNYSLLDLIKNKVLDGSQFIGHEFLSVNDGKISNRKLIVSKK